VRCLFLVAFSLYSNIKSDSLLDSDVQGVKINGRSIDRAFLWHDEIVNGGSLVFDMGSKPAAWDIGALPPSLSTGGFVR
jgi:putative alpha-1,2-mannosidase